VFSSITLQPPHETDHPPITGCPRRRFAGQVVFAGGHGSGSGTVHVHGYYRKDGTYVHAYDRSAPGTASHSSAYNSSTGATTSSANTSNAATTAAVAVPVSPPDFRSSTQTVQDAIAAGRIVVKNPKPVVKDTKPVVTSTTTSVSASGVARDANGKIKRSESAKREFMRMRGYPDGRPGYVVDHIIPLKRGGCDCASNMQWQTIQEAKAKDKWE
jgi:hypothetical protein